MLFDWNDCVWRTLNKHRVKEYPELEGTYKAYQIHLLAPHRTAQKWDHLWEIWERKDKWRGEHTGCWLHRADQSIGSKRKALKVASLNTLPGPWSHQPGVGDEASWHHVSSYLWACATALLLTLPRWIKATSPCWTDMMTWVSWVKWNLSSYRETCSVRRAQFAGEGWLWL